jgi:hypothetical protein
MPEKSGRQYVAKMRAHAQRAVEFFSNHARAERERAVCRAFLRCLGIPFTEAEIVAPAAEPVDVSFRDARFQMRDHRAPGAQPHAEWKARLARATQARSMDDAIGPWPRVPEWSGTTPMSLTELTVAITEALEDKARRYGKDCGTLDALVYADLTWTRSLGLHTEPGDTARLIEQGWRSVSVLFPMIGLVLCARDEAPRFLRGVAGTALYRWPDPDTLFDP